MNAVNPKAHEPSMEEILASIRRIIADDQETGRGGDEVYSNTSPLQNVLELAERHVVPLSFGDVEDADLEEESHESAADEDERPLAAAAPVVVASSEPGLTAPSDVGRIPAPANAPELPARVVVKVQTEPSVVLPEGSAARKAALDEPAQDNLLSSAANASVCDAFGRLGSSLAKGTPRSLEDVVADMLRPLLKEWLDENLPPLVERLVQAEIERISRARR